MTVKSWLDWFFINPEYTFVANIITNFTLALILSSTEFGVIWYIIFVLGFESLIWFLSKGLPPYGDPFFRMSYIYAGIAGFILGRSLAFNFTANPFESNILPEEPETE